MSIFNVAARGIGSFGDDLLRTLGDDVVRTVGDDAVRAIGDDLVRGFGDDAARSFGDDIARTVDYEPIDDIARTVDYEPVDDIARTVDYEPVDDIARTVGYDPARVVDDSVRHTIPSRYDLGRELRMWGGDDALRAPSGFDDLADDMDTMIWSDGIELSGEGVVRYGYGGPAGVLEDPARFTLNHDFADLSGFPRLQERLQPGRYLDDVWRAPDELTTSSWLDDATTYRPHEPELPTYQSWEPDPFPMDGGFGFDAF